MYTLNRSGNWQKIPCVEYYSPSKLVKANEYKRYLQRILKAKKTRFIEYNHTSVPSIRNKKSSVR